MSDLGQRIRDAIAASVQDAQPPPGLIEAVRRRHRRRILRASGTAAAAVVAVAVTASLLGVQRPGLGSQRPGAGASQAATPSRAPAIFPGGGRLLLADQGTLRWLYPDGRTIWIPGRFDGATVSAGHLLAWTFTSHGPRYSTMTLTGTRQRLVVPASKDKNLSVILALLSPDGSRLAYICQDIVSAAVVTDTLWVRNLRTGGMIDAGIVGTSAFAWRGDSAILVGAADGRSLLQVSAATGTMTTFAVVTDPVLIRAYEHASPGARRPAYIGSDGLDGTGGSSPVAIWLAAAAPGHHGTFPQTTAFTRPAEVVLSGTRPIASYAPRTPEELGLTFGPHGLVLLSTGAGDTPGSWNAYLATLGSGGLSAPIPLGMDGATFNPAGNVIAFQDSGHVTFVPTPAPACARTARCLSFRPVNLLQGGTIQAWAGPG